MSSTEMFAEPMLDSDEYLEKFKKQVNELKRKGLLHKFDATLTYKVYSIRGSDFGAHKSIVFTTDDKHFFTVELGFRVADGTVRVKGGMSFRNGMWHGLRNDTIMRNVKYGNWRKEIN